LNILKKIFGKQTESNLDSEKTMKPFKEVLNEIQSEIHKRLLKPNGYKKSGRTFNKINENGIIEVINFQSGKYQFENTIEIPGLRENLYGSFTINIGILIPELYFKDYPKEKEKKIYQEYNCTIRTRIGSLINDGDDLWWNLTENHKEKVTSNILAYLENQGMEWINKLNSREKIYRNWIELADIYESSLTAKLNIAKMKILNGEKDGNELFVEYYNETEKGPHKKWLVKEAKKYNVKIKTAPNNGYN